MDARELIRAGRLADARRELVRKVRAAPGDTASRTLLFQVLCFCGEWDRAAGHLDLIGQRDPSRETGVQMYRNLIGAEKIRLDVVRLGRRPSFLPEAPPYAEAHFAAWEALERGDEGEALRIREEGRDGGPVLRGTLNGAAFSGFCDTDSFFGPFLEVVVFDRYVWMPLEAVREIQVPAPKTLLETLWVPAHVTAWDGLTLNAWLPVLYPGSWEHADDRVKLGRMTDWTSAGGPFTRARGQHVFAVGETEAALLELRELVFVPPENLEEGSGHD